MSIDFPTNLDTLTNPTATDKVATVDHASQHANANDAIEALEAKVGKNSSGVTTSHDYKLSGVTGADKAVSITGSEVLTNKTLTSPTINTPVITTPKITTSINDVNGNEVIKTPATASAVNEVEITNAATGNDPLIAPSGNDTDIGLKLKGKGTGKVKVGDAELQMPDVDGTNGQLLKTNGSAVLSWVGATSVPDADESTAGLVEEATDGEVTAGTATGATGAKLFITPAKLATYLNSTVFTATVSVSSNEIKNWNATPKVLVAAPGSGKIIMVDSYIANFTAGTQYTGGANWGVHYDGDFTLLGSTIFNSNIITSASSSINYRLPPTTLVLTSVAENKAVVLNPYTAGQGEFADGNGTLKIYIQYRTITL